MKHCLFRQLLPAALLLLKAAGAYCAPGETKPSTLKGTIKGGKQTTVAYLTYKDAGKLVRDSALITNGQFVFKGAISRPQLANLYLKANPGEQYAAGSRRIYLDPGAITLQGNSTLDSVVVTGSASTKLIDEWNTLSKPYSTHLNELATRSWFNRANRDSIRLLKEENDQVMQDLQQALTAFVKQHPDSWVSWDLVEGRRVAMNPETFEPSFNALSASFKNSPEGQELVEQIASVKQTEIGVRSPDFSQNDTHGNAVSLRSLRGKYVLIDFWASWCGICRLENPNVLRAYDAYKDSGFTVLGVSLDDVKDKWIKAVKEDNMPWQQVCDLKGAKNDVAMQYGIKGIPQNVLLDPNGVIIAKNLRDRDLMNKLMELFDGGRNVRVDGTIDGLQDHKMVVRYTKNEKPAIDTVTINNGHFTWLSTIPEPEKIQATLLPSGRNLQFFADNGYLQLSGKADSLDRLHIKGSWMEEEAQFFYARNVNATDQQKMDYIHARPNSLLSLNLVNDLVLSGAAYAKVYPLYRSLSDVVRGMPTGRRIAATLSTMQKN